jgi:hypothetical protein
LAVFQTPNQNTLASVKRRAFGSPAAAAFSTTSAERLSGRIRTGRPGGGGADFGPLAERGTVLMSFIPAAQSHSVFFYSARDVLEGVHPRELEWGAVVMAVVAYVLAQEGI